MAEPLPAASSEAPENLPANAEDRAAAVALSALKTTTAAATDDAEAQPGTGAPSKADQEALGKAMSRLETLANAPGKTGSGAAAGTVRATGAGKKDSTVTATTTTTTKSGVEKKEEEKVVKKPAVKVKAEDVSVLVSCGCITPVGWELRVLDVGTLTMRYWELYRSTSWTLRN